MHIHVLGICGTFMGGLAVIAKQAGHEVTGCDANVYPPMSTQLETQGIGLTEGWDPGQVDLAPDLFVIGNVVSRGNPLMEEILNRRLAYASGPQWLAENVLHGKWVLGVAGTHGKTSTSAMLAWILEHAGYHPGFLIGGVPLDFGVSARITDSRFFVIEADEYDTAFFDKRSKFVHYRPSTVILNNLEFDHADIFADLSAIETQFHHLVRTIPANGLIVANGAEESLQRVLELGCWTPVEWLDRPDGWSIRGAEDVGDFEVLFAGQAQGRLQWGLSGRHNSMNALAALAAARHAGVPTATGIEALSRFKNVKRRMELRGEVNGITIYDDFAHHPTAIESTLAGLRATVGDSRIVAVFEPRSNTMKMGSIKQALCPSLAAADLVFCYTNGLDWDVAGTLQPLGEKSQCFDDIDTLVRAIVSSARKGDQVVIMSNGGFANIHEKLLAELRES
ncbi:MAG: UDP-N-acetylmuramate:L-alanyl-gamma-D-glutamyl-meso-diaminopimelate ligase [Betaproteobacteria bacterium]|nr:MAG: UDP-N-acetylmuramate:L-alanyl-gamma-D-glutamyl-meso-diaminopimelate ligase [Betaproteobacteria bacterium]